MNKANQNVLIQNTNITLINIRFLEISYFSVFFSSFGTQTTLFIGFVCGCISQVPALHGNINYGLKCYYWITSVISIATAVHCLMCSILVSVFGQGLAIRGPPGAMVEAVDGMVFEQQQAVISFVISAVFFQLSMMGMNFFMADFLSALCSSILSLVVMVFWYRSLLRIYNFFKYDAADKSRWSEEIDRSKELGDLIPDKDPSDVYNQSTEDMMKVSAEGFIAIKLLNHGAGDPWKRRYLVLHGNYGFYYKDRRSYELESSKPINRRPIEFDGYHLMRDSKRNDFCINLEPDDPEDIRKGWEFRCDTEQEYIAWSEHFEKAIGFTEASLSL